MNEDIDRGRFELVNFYLSLLLVEYLCLVFICLLRNQNNYDLFSTGSLQVVRRCHQTDLVMDKGCVKISTRNRPLSPWGIISWTVLVSLRLAH